MRTAVVGAGAMGGMLGARLAAGGGDTLMVDVAAPLVDRINAEGLTVTHDGRARTARLEAVTDPEGQAAADVVFILVKCYHTDDAARLVAPLVDERTVVVSLQNGWGNGDVLARRLPPAQLVVGVTYNSATVDGPARVRHTGAGATYLGPFEGEDLAAAQLAGTALQQAGLEVEVTSDVRTEIWRKVVLNAATLPTAALTGLRAGPLGEHAAMAELVAGAAAEAVAVGRAQGFALDSAERDKRIRETLAKAGTGKASMLQDFEAGRRSEVDVVNGAVIEAADRLDVDVPINRTLLSLVKGWEHARGLS